MWFLFKGNQRIICRANNLLDGVKNQERIFNPMLAVLRICCFLCEVCLQIILWVPLKKEPVGPGPQI